MHHRRGGTLLLGMGEQRTCNLLSLVARDDGHGGREGEGGGGMVMEGEKEGESEGGRAWDNSPEIILEMYCCCQGEGLRRGRRMDATIIMKRKEEKNKVEGLFALKDQG